MISFSLLFLPATQFFSTMNPWRAFWADIEPFKSSQLRLVHCFWNFTDTRTQSGVLAQVTRYNRSKPILFMKCVKILKIHFALHWFLNVKGGNTIRLSCWPDLLMAVVGVGSLVTASDASRSAVSWTRRESGGTRSGGLSTWGKFRRGRQEQISGKGSRSLVQSSRSPYTSGTGGEF